MGNVRKRAAVHNHRRSFQRLHQIGVDRVAQQRRHGALRFQVLRIYRFAVQIIRHQNVPQAFLQIRAVGSQAEDRHHLAGHRDDKAILARDSIHLSAEPYHHVAQGAVVHIEAAFDQHTALVDAQLVPLLHVIVEHGAQQVVCRSQCVHITGKVEVDILHRHHLCITAAGRAALDAEHRTEGRLAQGDDRILPDLCHCFAQPRRCGGLSLSRRGRVDRGHQDQLSILSILEAVVKRVVQLRLKPAVRFQLFFPDPKGSGDLCDGCHLGLLSNFNIRQHSHSPFK